MFKRHQTNIARIGMFPLGTVKSPITPAVNATTFVTQTLDDLATIDDSSLTRASSGVFDGLYYGGIDTPTTLHLAAQIAALERGRNAVLTPSGQSAVAIAMSALVQPGDHLLVGDTTTYTTKWLFDQHFARTGVQVEYFSPNDAAIISKKLKPNTKAVFMECPGAFTYELIEIEPIVEACRRHNVITVVDNTWAASTFFHPLTRGIDLSVVSLTKTHAAVAGISLGAVISNRDDLHASIKSQAALLGYHVSSEACSNALMSISTLGTRLSHQMCSTDMVIDALGSLERISRILHPSLQTNYDYDLFRRYFSGYNSLLSVEFDMTTEEIISRVNQLKVVSIGYGWGGTISLVNVFDPNKWRTVSQSEATGTCIRFYIGLEDASDIAEDISQAFQ